MMKVKESDFYKDCEVYALFADDVYFAYDEDEGLASLQKVADEWEVDIELEDVKECIDFMHGWDD